MTKEEAFTLVQGALAAATGQQTEITQETHLLSEEVLDSLDAAVFLLEVEKASGMKLPEALVEEKELFHVGNLINQLAD